MEDKRTEQYRQELKKFVMSHTEDVLKNPRSFIRYPFIDPGSVYDGNVWDWDTYWSVYGFLNLGFLSGSVCEAENYRARTGEYPQFLRPPAGRWIYSHDDRGGRLAGALSEYEA